jgi:TolB-like protein/tetratricopeptide (TPR) repeat protein
VAQLRARIVRFGVFELNLHSQELRKQGTLIRLQDKPLRFLLLLLSRPGDIVTRGEVQRALWPDTHVGFDHNMNLALNRLRRALGDSPSNPRFIETIPRRGYRFIAPLHSPAPASGRTSDEPGKLRLAVLPFENLTGTSDQDYFAESVTEEIISRLGQLSPANLGVIARTSVAGYKGATSRVKQVAEDLNVDYVVEGSVRSTRDHVRITAQLIQTTDETHVWVQSYNRPLDEIFRIQDDVAENVARSLATELLPDQSSTIVRSYETTLNANLRYIKGRYHQSRVTPQSLLASIRHFEEAIEIDPRFARAYSGLADSLMLLIMPGYANDSPHNRAPRAREAAQKALEIDSNLAEAHVSLGFALHFYDWDWTNAEQEYRRAIELDPNYAPARFMLSRLLSCLGLHEQAVAAADAALEIDPLSLRANLIKISALYGAGRFGEILRHSEAMLKYCSALPMAHYFLGFCHEMESNWTDAIAEHEKAVQMNPSNGTYLSGLGHAYAKCGGREQTHVILERTQALPSVSAFDLALIYVGLGETDQALRWLEKALYERSSWLAYCKTEPRLRPLHHESRFRELVSKIGIPLNP